jgi:hypothetical protein
MTEGLAIQSRQLSRRIMRHYARLWRGESAPEVASYYFRESIWWRDYSAKEARSLFFAPEGQGKPQSGVDEDRTRTSAEPRAKHAVCAWCEKELPEVVETAGTSHGICRPCHDKALAEVGR